MPQNRLLLPLSILAAGLIIALSVYFYLRVPEPDLISITDLASSVRPLDDSDHILGNPAAPIMFIEYSDIDSPFAKIFEKSLRSIIAEYGDTGDVAWTYRHLPVIDQHPAAVSHAEAAECMNAQGGAPAFFRFIEEIHAVSPGTTEFSPVGYPGIVQKLQGNLEAFQACMDEDTYLERIADDADNALASGAVGAPYTVLIVKGQEPMPIEGAVSMDQLKALVEASLERI